MTVEVFGQSLWLGDPSRFALVALGAGLFIGFVLAGIIELLAHIRRRRIRRKYRHRTYGGTVKH